MLTLARSQCSGASRTASPSAHCVRELGHYQKVSLSLSHTHTHTHKQTHAESLQRWGEGRRAGVVERRDLAARGETDCRNLLRASARELPEPRVHQLLPPHLIVLVLHGSPRRTAGPPHRPPVHQLLRPPLEQGGGRGQRRDWREHLKGWDRVEGGVQDRVQDRIG